jgi:hypothetical protein
MNLQDKMFAEVESWVSSGASKTAFLEGKGYSDAKFNYWLAKWKASQRVGTNAGFREVGFSEVNPIAIGLGKVLEIEAPSGVKITVFA